jgi:hypothetical protein
MLIGSLLREAEEEIGLPRGKVRVVGLLDDIPSWDNTQSVTPVVGKHACTHTRVRMRAHRMRAHAHARTRACAQVRWRTTSRWRSCRETRAKLPPLFTSHSQARWSTRSVCWRDRKVPMYYFDVRGYANAGDGERL